MAVKIRMKRLGAKKAPFYRIVVADSRRARNGRFIEELGFYNPISEPRMFRIDADKVKYWVSNGAQESETVKRLFKEYGVFEAEGTLSFGISEEKKEIGQVTDFTKNESVKKEEENNEVQENEVEDREEAKEESEENTEA